MLVRIARVGTGTSADQFRIPLPTYTMVADDPVNGAHIVDVPADDFPPGLVDNPGLTRAALAQGNTITAMPPGILQQWTAHLHARYGRPPGTFAPAVK